MTLGEFLHVERAVSDYEWLINSGFQNKLGIFQHLSDEITGGS